MSNPTRSPRRAFALASLLTALLPTSVFAQQAKASPGRPNAFARPYKMDAVVATRSRSTSEQRSSLLVRVAAGATLPPQFQRYARARALGVINAVQLDDVPSSQLQQLAASGAVVSIHDNRPAMLHNYRTAVTVGARIAQDRLGLTGRGVTVAVIDSGITTFHDDLTRTGGSRSYPYGDQRLVRFVDFVGGRTLPYDDNGHGTHVAGTIAGNGYDSNGEKAGIAPEASIVSLKVLDDQGRGTIGSIIAALDWVAGNARAYNIRVVNLSVGAAIRESYWTDPLTLAVRALTAQGIVVVAAAGNLGRNANGEPLYGGITAPGNAPWTLTVGASSTQGTLTRRDDNMADYSSRGPTFLDWAAKPDLVAPGSGTVSLAAPGSTLFASKASYLVPGAFNTATSPYLTLTGTSMAAPVVSGTVALMMQANPRLTPNLVKAILQYTSEIHGGYDPLTEGAGFLNTLGAVRLAKFYANPRPGLVVPIQRIWSHQILWGTHRITGGIMVPAANAWDPSVVWGSPKTLGSDGDNIVWGTALNDNIVWGTDSQDNIVWGTWDVDNIVWGTRIDGDNIVWGTVDSDNIVWGTNCGGADCDQVVWGTESLDNIVWGTWGVDNIVWGTQDADNIVWGTWDTDNIVWGTWAADNIVWGTTATDNIVWGTAAGDGIWGIAPADEVQWPDTARTQPSEQAEFEHVTAGRQR